MATKEEKAREAGIDLAGGRTDYRSPCPKCSPDRRKKKDPCLHVTVEAREIKAFCHHCSWGMIFDDDEFRLDGVRRDKAGQRRAVVPARAKRWW